MISGDKGVIWTDGGDDAFEIGIAIMAEAKASNMSSDLVFMKDVGGPRRVQWVKVLAKEIADFEPTQGTQTEPNETGASATSSQQTDSLEEKYIEAAHELQSKQRDLLNFAPELHAFIEIRDALKEYADFSGHLPETHFSGGDLDPIGASPQTRPARMHS